MGKVQPYSLSRIEKICLAEFGRLVRRNRRYFITFLAIYFYSLAGWRRKRLLRAGHCLAQHVDDVLDGDLPMPDPQQYAAALLDQIDSGNYGDTDAALLARFVFTEADAHVPGLRAELRSLFDTLLFDRRRSDESLILPEAALAEQHCRTFIHSVNSSLMMAGSRLRADEVPEIVGALCWVSPMRDLEEDLARGLVNVPAEVLAASGTVSLDYAALLSTEPVRAWIRAEYNRGQVHLKALPGRLRKLGLQRGRLEVWAFYFEISRYAQRYARIHADILGGGRP